MTATFLQSELLSLIQDSKKKYPDVRAAAENSLNELKALSITSEAQIAGDLRRKPQFVDAFVLACRTKNAKLASGGVVCLQRLTACQAVPRDRLSDVVGAFHQIAALGLDVQLKILQTLPSLLQLYAEDLRDELLASTLGVCDILQGSRTQMVSSTAAATFQQLITTVYERVAAEDQDDSAPAKTLVKIGNEQVELGTAALDAFRVFHDLCALVDNSQPQYAQIRNLPPALTLEVIDSALTNHGATIATHEEQLGICRTKLLPALVSMLEAKPSFPLCLRVLRIIRTLVKEHLTELVDQCERALASMVQDLEPNPPQNWRRTLSMEVFCDISSDFKLIRHLVRVYDYEKDRPNIIGDLVAAFVRISSENPPLIGHGRQSTTPQTRQAPGGDQTITSYESTGIGGAIGNVASAISESAGISVEWSDLRSPCLDQLDKAELTELPPTYIYTLILRCIADLGDGLSKFVMPLSVPRKEQTQKPAAMREDQTDTEPNDQMRSSLMAHKYQRLVNPLRMQNSAQLDEIKLCAGMIEQYWPAFLATCSTFLNAALDSHYYHTLIRAVQKMTQVAGVLELVTARDALLTCISKAALPVTSSSTTLSFRDRTSRQKSIANSPDLNQTSELTSPQSSFWKMPFESGRQTMTIRNMLCLRALLNLGIALGPTLSEDAWFILIETLEQAEALAELPQNMTANTSPEGNVIAEESKASLSSEITAMRTASKRMLDSTKGYSNNSFCHLIVALFKLVSMIAPSASSESTMRSPSVGSPRAGRMHQASRSMSGVLGMSNSHEAELQFVLAKVSDLSRINLHRFASADAVNVSWDLIVTNLLDLLTASGSSYETRLRCASIIDSIAAETMKLVNQTHTGGSSIDDTYHRCLGSLTAQLQIMAMDGRALDPESVNANMEIHMRLLMTIENILGHCGDSFGHQWNTVFELITSIFEDEHDDENQGFMRKGSSRPRTVKLLQMAFRTVQLIVSDFLNSLSISSTVALVLLLEPFAAQKEELNISLSTVTFYWNIMVLVQENLQTIDPAYPLKDSLTEFAPQHVWYAVLNGLLTLCSDDREDVRQSSIRMVLKTLETSGSKMTGEAWNSCLGDILSRLLVLDDMTGTNRMGTLCNYPSSATQLFTGVVDIFVQHTALIVKTQDFATTWSIFSKVLSSMLGSGLLDTSAAVFAGTSRMLHSLRIVDGYDERWTQPLLSLWLEHHPVEITKEVLQPDFESAGRMPSTSNQEAYFQHANCFAEILRSLGPQSSEQVAADKVMLCLRETIFTCSHPRYTSDLKTPSPEQKSVLQILPMLQRLMEHRQRDYMIFILDLIAAPRHQEDILTLATAKTPKQASTQIPTLVAFRKSCIAIYVQNALSDELVDRSIHEVAIPCAVSTLAKITNTKYTVLPQGSDPPLWQSATTAACEIITWAVQQIRNRPEDTTTDYLEFFVGAIEEATSVLDSGGDEAWKDLPADSQPRTDEDFEVQAIIRLHNALVPVLGSPFIPPSIQKSYILSLFHASLIAKPFPFDLPLDLTTHPLQNLTKVRMGTVCPPLFARRQQICHTALDLLFGLVRRPDGPNKEELSTLAKITAPYALIRTSHTFKTFLADQPLRSLDALPPLLRKEMITVLSMCLTLRSDDGAWAALANSRADLGSDGKAHLRLLYPLILRVQEGWRRLPRMREGNNWQDQEEGREIERLLDEWGKLLGEDWDVDDHVE